MRRRWWRALGERIDGALVRGQVWFLVLIVLAAIAVALVAASVVSLLGVDFGRGHLGFGRAAWQTLVRTLDPGQIAEDRGPGAFVMLGITLIGLVLMSSLIALMTNKVQQRVEKANRGRTPLQMEEHHVVLGWTDLTLKVLEQLHDSDPDDPPPTVVMADVPVTEMRQRLDERRRDVLHSERNNRSSRGDARANSQVWSKTWPRLRTGDPADKRDLERIACVHEAHSVIVLSPDLIGAVDGLDEVDRERRQEACTSEMVKTVLAIHAELVDQDNGAPADAASARRRPVIVVECAHDPDKAELLRRRLEPTGTRIVVVDALGLRANLAAQVCRRPGLAAVYSDLLDFAGNEFRIVEVPSGVATFGEAVTRLTDACAVAVVSHTGTLACWPGWDQPLHAGDRLVVLAESDALLPPDRSIPGIVGERPVDPVPGSTGGVLLLGWNSRATQLIRSIRRGHGHPPDVLVVSENDVAEELARTWPGGGVHHRRPEQGVQSWLEQTADRSAFRHAIVLTDETKPPAVADAETLLTFLALRPLGEEHGNPETAVAELQQRSSRHLVASHEATDLLASGSFTADALAQYAVNPDIAELFSALLGAGDIEIDLVPPDRYALPDTVDFAALVRAVAERGEIALGYRSAPVGDATGAPMTPELVLNPSRTAAEAVVRARIFDVVVVARGGDCRNRGGPAIGRMRSTSAP